MRYEVRKSVINVLGTMWMPPVTGATMMNLSTEDVENIRQYGHGAVNRESVGAWLDTHAGDFSGIVDFMASIESGDDTIDIGWADNESEYTFNDAMYPDEDQAGDPAQWIDER